ncbi:unnamed protein product [Dibothriocephalus latus]|uniref:Uncharacterized protein n=1 Tax=Dibothriocephalus latus TaxID=60516 RepID=A0A3P6V1D7_DIBLA|nr:unnamed protein product [Dibothriocephalus latus]
MSDQNWMSVDSDRVDFARLPDEISDSPSLFQNTPVFRNYSAGSLNANSFSPNHTSPSLSGKLMPQNGQNSGTALNLPPTFRLDVIQLITYLDQSLSKDAVCSQAFSRPCEELRKACKQHAFEHAFILFGEIK